jgi:hypothetical protein
MTGQAQADAMLTCLDKRNLRPKVTGLCFDTTASNTGHHSSARVLIELALGRNLLHLASRNHMMEVISNATKSVHCIEDGISFIWA